MTVSSYMILEHSQSRIYLGDEHFFLHDKTQSIFKLRNIKNQCIDLFSSLIEIFGDHAITSILKIITKLLEDQPFEEDKTEEEESDYNLKEYAYMSTNAKHPWKRKDVAMILLGLFIEDIQMYCLRN